MDATGVSIGSCPKCQADRSEDATECARCGIIFSKYRALAARPSTATAGLSTESLWWLAAKDWMIESNKVSDSITFYGRLAVYLGLLWWGRIFIMTPLETNYTGESFLHLINLPFHEAGHVIFSPFGRFMTILGGSLGQVLMPMICLGTFLIKTRDPFGASVALWWTAESLMDVAPYINDARDLELMLLGGVTGKETDGHDWNNLLTMMGLLNWDHRLAHLTYTMGILLMVVSWLWGGLLLRRHYHRLSS